MCKAACIVCHTTTVQLSGSDAEILNKQHQQSTLCDEGIFKVKDHYCSTIYNAVSSLQHRIIWRIPDDGLTSAVLISIMKNHKGKAM